MNYHLSLKSSNKKTGPIPVSTTESDSCPDSCPLKFLRDEEGEIVFKKMPDGTVSPLPGACYGKHGPISWHWKAVDKGRGGNFDEFLKAIKALKANELWRHNQVGDLPGENESIDYGALSRLVAANGDSKGFTYTHKKKALRTAKGLKAVQVANSKGFTINVSCDNVSEVDEFRAKGLPATVVIPEDTPSFKTPGGNVVKICPAQLEDDRRIKRAESEGYVGKKAFGEWEKANPRKVSCKTCALCQVADRKHVIGFRAHGVKKDLIELS